MARQDKATVDVKYYASNTLPNVNKYPVRETMDMTAATLSSALFANPNLPPYNVETAISETGTPIALHPSKKFTMISNYIDKDDRYPTDSRTARKIIWHAIDTYTDPVTSLTNHLWPKYPYLNNLTKNSVKSFDAVVVNAKDKWRTTTATKTVTDIEDMQEAGVESPPSFPGEKLPVEKSGRVAEEDEAKTKLINDDIANKQEKNFQTSIEHAMAIPDEIWGVWCEPKFGDGIGFWLSIDRRTSVASKVKDFILIRIWLNGYLLDLLFKQGEPAKLYDWAKLDSKGNPKETPLATDMWDGGSLFIGVMPVLGYINFFINGRQVAFARHIGVPSAGQNSQELAETPQSNKAKTSATPPKVIASPKTKNMSSSAYNMGMIRSVSRVVKTFTKAETLSGGTGEATSPPTEGVEKTSEFELQPVHFKLDKMYIFGSSSMATINLSAMTFKSAVFPSPTSYDPTVNQFGTSSGNWGGSDSGGFQIDTSATLIDLPGQDQDQKAVGACAGTVTFQGTTSDVKAKNDPEFEKRCPKLARTAKIVFGWVKNALGINDTLPSGLGGYGGGTSGGAGAGRSWEEEKTEKEEEKTYMGVSMFPASAKMGQDDTSKNELNVIPPFFFRMRGIYDNEMSPQDFGTTGTSLSDDLISLTENFSSDDNSLISHSIDIVLYNADGRNDRFTEASYGIKVKAHGLEFTGVTLDATKVQTAGKETISIHCEDYMLILDHKILMNSPFYDGMDSFDVIQDVLRRTGLSAVDDTSENYRYYIPSGFSYLEPRYRLSPNQSVKTGIAEIAKLGEKIAYFDGDGVLHWSNLQGGISYDLDTTPKYHFYKCPAGHRDDQVVLQELSVEYMGSAPVNEIMVFSVDRMSSNFVVVHDVAPKPVVPYKKVLFIDQPAFGSFDATVAWVNMIRQRVYKVPRRITFKTISTEPIIPAKHFIEVDGKRYRVKSVSRAFNAEDNSLVSTITGEWFGAGN